MALHQLATISAGLKTLAELEKLNPKLGKDLVAFLDKVGSACDDAYRNFSSVLMQVLALPNPPSREDYDRVSKAMAATYDHDWFKNVADVCARLKAADSAYSATVEAHIKELQTEVSANIPQQAGVALPPAIKNQQQDLDTLRSMISTLRSHEASLENEIASNVYMLQNKLANGFSKGDISDAKQSAVETIAGIKTLLDTVQHTKLKVQGTSEQWAEKILLARQVLDQDPFKLLKLNAAILIFLLLLGASVLQYLSIIQFVALSAFILAAVVIMNAIMLVNSGVIDQKAFLEALRLSLTGTFVPIVGLLIPTTGHRSNSIGANPGKPRTAPRRTAKPRAGKDEQN